jgi:hypothetical protein
LFAQTVHLDQKLCFDSSWWLILTVTTISSHWIDLVDENYARFLVSGHWKELFDNFLTLTNVFTHDVTAANTKERAIIHFVSTGFGNKSFTRSGRAVEKDSLPGFSWASKYLRESHGHDDSFFKSLLCFGKTSNIIPSDFRFLADNNTVEVAFYGRLLFFIKDFFTLIVFYVVAHHFKIVEEVVESRFEGLFIVLAFGLKELDEFLVVRFGILFGFFHYLEILFFCGFVELGDFLFHFVLVQFPRFVNVHPKVDSLTIKA